MTGSGIRMPMGMAIAASIGVHAIALGALMAHRPRQVTGAAVRIVDVELAPTSAWIKSLSTPDTVSIAPARSVVAQEPVSLGSPHQTPSSSHQPSQPSEGQVGTVEPTNAVPATRTPGVPQPVAPSAASQSEPDPSLEYKRRVWAHLADHRPRAEPGAGEATVKFGVKGTGALAFARLERSSGRPAFDRACLASVRAATPFPAPPQQIISGGDLVFEVAIRASETQ